MREVEVRSRIVVAVATATAALAVAGCGGSANGGGGAGQSSQKAAATPTVAQASTAGANPVAAPPVAETALRSGSASDRIRATVAAFYRAAWENDAAGACAQFSPSGVVGFMRAAKISFPGSINQYSTCAEAMKIYNASLGASITQLQNSDPSVSGAALNNVKISAIKINGGEASAIGPLNALPMINPKLIDLVRSGGRWLIAGSYSLSKSKLPQLLKQAEASGALKSSRR